MKTGRATTAILPRHRWNEDREEEVAHVKTQLAPR